MNSIIVRLADWETDGEALREIRRKVFSVEQKVAEELDIDGRDAQCFHALACIESDSGVTPLGTARLDPAGHIGRVAVLEEYRRRGIGTRLTELLIAHAVKNGFDQVDLHSQTHAIRFYERLGFTSHGDEFLEADIPHVCMVKRL